jgi:hypothetical protein
MNLEPESEVVTEERVLTDGTHPFMYRASGLAGQGSAHAHFKLTQTPSSFLYFERV